MNDTTKSVTFLSYPSLGILDNWLPVLWDLKRLRPDVTIAAVLPRERIVQEIDASDILVRIGDEVFDNVVFRTGTRDWIKCRSLSQAKSINHSLRGWRLQAWKLRSFFYRDKEKELRSLGEDTQLLVGDLFARSRREGRDILKKFRGAAHFSLYHGLAVADEDYLPKTKIDLGEQPRGVIAYLYSSHEIEAYKKSYQLSEDQLKVVGVPRHDPRWIAEIVRRSRGDLPEGWRDYIFVISRPAITAYLNKEEKRRCVQDFARLADELKSRIVVKLHPAERVAKNKDSIYEDVFGRENYGTKWIYSAAHPFFLGKHCKFAVSFYTGVHIDLIAIGVPTIERLNITARDDIDSRDFESVMQHRKRKLILSSQNYDQMRAQAMRILHHREAVMKILRASYHEFFSPIRDPLKIIVDDICKEL